MNPGFVEAYFNRGLAYVQVGEYEKAIYDFTEVIRINPRYPEAFNNRGKAYYSEGQYDKAISDYTKAIEINQTRNLP
jgi:tetratricopeptide (TPR) repeat protein